MRRSRNLPLPAGRLDYIIFVSGITLYFSLDTSPVKFQSDNMKQNK